MRIINSKHAAQPLGHYAQAVVTGNLVFLSGILPVQRDGTIDSTMSFAEQTRLVMSNALEILREANCEFKNVVKSNIYLVGIENWSEFNEAYLQAFGEHKAARAVVPVTTLHHDFLVEIDMIAELPES